MSHEISLDVARRFLALRHLIAPARALPSGPESVLAVVDRIGSLQFDPLEVAGRNHDLVLHARVAGYRREMTDELLYGRRLLFESYNKSLNLLPSRELPWYRIAWDRAAAGRSGAMALEQSELASRILDAIDREGPQCSSDFDREPAIDWYWGPTTAVRAVLEALNAAGVLGLARREGNRRYFDRMERLFPADLLSARIPEREQYRHMLLSRYRAHGLLGTTGSGELWLGVPGASLRAELRAELVDRGELLPLAVEGLKGPRFIIGDELPLLGQAEREVAAEAAGQPVRPGEAGPSVVFLAPLDPLLWDREALQPLYGFDYRWEVYTPAAKRRWGYYVLPILFGDRLAGRIEPRIDRGAKTVRILGVGWEDRFEPLAEPGFVAAMADALGAYLEFGRADAVLAPPGRANRDLFRAVAAEGLRVAWRRVARPRGSDATTRRAPTGRLRRSPEVTAGAA